MRRAPRSWFPLMLILLWALPAGATIFGNVRGIAHDPQHRPVADAQVEIHSRSSAWSQTAKANAEGEFEFPAVPVGQYVVAVTAPGFNAMQQSVDVVSGSAPVLHFQLQLAALAQTVEVSGTPQTINPQSSTTESLVSRKEIARTPGADRADSLAMITDYVPGSYVVHDQLHVRGGHQVGWEVDGVPVPNTNIADTVGPQFHPQDIDYLEAQRGGYSAEYGDRAYGVFNVVTRTGFEGDNSGELVTSFGSENETNDYLGLGSHTQRFAYYASLNGNRTDLGLETPSRKVLHDLGNGFGGFASLIFNATPGDQLRLVSSARQDYFQVPNTPGQEAAGIRDVQKEDDAFVNFSWLHTAGQGLTLTVSPFYHFNRAHFVGGPNDTPVIPEYDRGSQYVGGQAAVSAVGGKHNARIGYLGVAQRDNTLFAVRAGDPGEIPLRQRQQPWGSVNAFFAEDQYKVLPWLTLNGGLRYTHYSASLVENAANPRVGAAIRLPRLGWTLRGYYGRYYQPPPLTSVSGPLVDFALRQGFGFLPLRGERDEQWEAGLAVPFRGWVLDTDYFHTRARNFFDHDELGNSNIFLPLTIDTARTRGWEATLRSPRLFRRAQFHVAFSHQFVQGRGAVTGGLTGFSPPDRGFFFLDHDQRNTLSYVFEVALPWRAWVSGHVLYGSGFLNGDGPGHLPGHATFDLSVGKDFDDRWSVRVSALNAAGNRYLLDNSNTFGGTHFNEPRQVAVQLRYRFRY